MNDLQKCVMAFPTFSKLNMTLHFDFFVFSKCAVTRIRTWVIAATTQCTNHYTITAELALCSIIAYINNILGVFGARLGLGLGLRLGLGLGLGFRD